MGYTLPVYERVVDGNVARPETTRAGSQRLDPLGALNTDELRKVKRDINLQDRRERQKEAAGYCDTCNLLYAFPLLRLFGVGTAPCYLKWLCLPLLLDALCGETVSRLSSTEVIRRI